MSQRNRWGRCGRNWRISTGKRQAEHRTALFHTKIAGLAYRFGKQTSPFPCYVCFGIASIAGSYYGGGSLVPPTIEKMNRCPLSGSFASWVYQLGVEPIHPQLSWIESGGPDRQCVGERAVTLAAHAGIGAGGGPTSCANTEVG